MNLDLRLANAKESFRGGKPGVAVMACPGPMAFMLVMSNNSSGSVRKFD